ncbi:MAG TPA: alpha/beta hydrolase [Marmoricola sp.]|nr:alpha/beta hydrolase [Marmoricola sp.]
MGHLVAVRDTELDVEVTGSGEPVVIIQTALDADELRPLAERTAAGGEHQVIQYRRRGYAPSGPVTGRASSVETEAADCRALLNALGVRRAHVVGVSYSAAIALTLAASAPDAVRTLAVMEPPPVHVPSAADFRAANARLLSTVQAGGVSTALDEFLTMLAGPGWRTASERARPGSVADLERDAVTFFTSDVPALLDWRFGVDDAARIGCPVLHVGGSDSGPWFAEVRAWVLRLLPQAEDATVEGAGHLFASTHPDRTAGLLVDFLRRHRTT